MSQFNFSLHDEVQIVGSNIIGRVIGRAEFIGDENSYQLRYVDSKGEPVKQWWNESDLVSRDLPQVAGVDPQADRPDRRP